MTVYHTDLLIWEFDSEDGNDLESLGDFFKDLGEELLEPRNGKAGVITRQVEMIVGECLIIAGLWYDMDMDSGITVIPGDCLRANYE